MSKIATLIDTSERAFVHVFGVGHGDCTLLEFEKNGIIEFRLLCDVGAKMPQALLDYFKTTKRPEECPTIDVLVLSHVDNDHQGGLPDLIKANITIGDYWGPCLPAFKRLKGIFPSRVQQAVERAEMFEESLSDSTQISYPLEGYTKQFANRRVTVSVISPPPRLILKLMTAGSTELENLVVNSPMPLEWLQDLDIDEEDNQSSFQLREVFRNRTLLSPNDFKEIVDVPFRTSSENISKLLIEKNSSTLEPDFFGNSVLNDTSLVVVIDFQLMGKVRRRVLLTGDQENWNYIASKHPTGLGIDLLKAPHHGGRTFIDDHTENIDQIYLWLRPNAVVVSAEGVHNLPRIDFREALRKVGATLLCPNSRTFEPLTSGATAKANELSCFKSYNCEPRKYSKFTIEITEKSQSANIPACVQGSGNRGFSPIVILQQRVVEPDELFMRWTHGEIERYANWIALQLEAIHKKSSTLIKNSSHPISNALLLELIDWSELEHQARLKGHFHLVVDPVPVFKFAKRHHLMTVVEKSGRVPENFKLYCVPTKTNIKNILNWLKTIPHILLEAHFDAADIYTGNRARQLKCAIWDSFIILLSAKFLIPYEVAKIEVMPHILETLENEFSAKICSGYDPHIIFPKLKNDKVWLILTRIKKSISFPNLLSELWYDFHFKTHKYNSEAKLEFLLNRASIDLFAPYTLASHDRVISFDFINLVMLKNLNYSNPEESLCNEFPAMFESIKWLQLWK